MSMHLVAMVSPLTKVAELGAELKELKQRVGVVENRLSTGEAIVRTMHPQVAALKEALTRVDERLVDLESGFGLGKWWEVVDCLSRELEQVKEGVGYLDSRIDQIFDQRVRSLVDEKIAVVKLELGKLFGAERNRIDQILDQRVRSLVDEKMAAAKWELGELFGAERRGREV